MCHRTQDLHVDIVELCTTLLPKVPNALDAVDFVRHGEPGVAVEMLSDWCVDVEPPITLSLTELLQLIAVVEPVAPRKYWVDLLPLLDDDGVRDLPQDFVALANAWLASEVPTNALRAAWLARVAAVLERRRA